MAHWVHKTCDWGLTPMEASNSASAHHPQWLVQPCGHGGPRAFLLGVDYLSLSVEQRR